MTKPVVRVACFKPDAKCPEYAYPTDTGADLFCAEDKFIEPHETALISTGIKMEFPAGWAGFILEKSGLALKKGVQIMGGVIDSTYRGEVNIIVHNVSNQKLWIPKGQKVAQIEIRPIFQAEFVSVLAVNETDRNDKGFGSSGR